VLVNSSLTAGLLLTTTILCWFGLQKSWPQPHLWKRLFWLFLLLTVLYILLTALQFVLRIP